LIITYSSGKTQTIPLDDAIHSISSLQYLTSEGTRNNNGGGVESKPPQDAASVNKSGSNPPPKSKPASNGNIKFRWANPLEGE